MRKNLLITLCVLTILSCKHPQQNEWKLDSFTKPAENPILKADSTFIFNCPIQKKLVQWQKADVFNPAAIVRDGKVYLLFRAEDNKAASYAHRTSRIGLAVSEDGIHFTKMNEPVLFPDTSAFKQYDYPGGCEDPRIVETEDGTYVLAYTSWNNEVARLTIAFSKDLLHWEKKGLAFAKAYDGKFFNSWSKSGSIVTKFVNDKPIAAKINGKYWMYWGEAFINLAWSENLVDWTPLVDEKGELKQLVKARKNMFDSNLTECGPPAFITDEGIVLLYNGKNAEGENADPNLPKGTYTVGKVVFDPENMEKVISRSDTCFLKPTLPHEVSGQYQSGTTFSEGLVRFQSKWFLYYGTADSYVGVAVH